jgi:hypothetical protein
LSWSSCPITNGATPKHRQCDSVWHREKLACFQCCIDPLRPPDLSGVDESLKHFNPSQPLTLPSMARLCSAAVRIGTASTFALCVRSSPHTNCLLRRRFASGDIAKENQNEANEVTADCKYIFVGATHSRMLLDPSGRTSRTSWTTRRVGLR